jgi:hypothetical protein
VKSKPVKSKPVKSKPIENATWLRSPTQYQLGA